MSDRYDDLNKVWDDRSFSSYSKFTDHPGRYIVGGLVAAVLLIGVLTFGGWEIGWWFKGQNVNRESHILRNSYANQQTLRDQITAQIGNVLSIGPQIAEEPSAAPQLKAQRAAIVNIVCGDAVQVVGDPLPSSQATFIKSNCLDGSINPSSSLATH